MISLTTTIRRPGIIVAGLVVAMAISTASRGKCQLILVLRAFSGTVTWTATLEAEPIVGTGSRSSKQWILRSWLPWWWRRCSWMVHAVRNLDTVLLR